MTETDSVSDPSRQLRAAISLVSATPGYDAVGSDLSSLYDRGKLEFVPNLEDRGQATLGGRLLIGPEAIYGGLVSLAETLVHEHWHLRHQLPLEKTASFWAGVVTGKHVMRRYEMPAYKAALQFLAAVEVTFPHFAAEARIERDSIHASFTQFYGGPIAG